MKKSKEYAKIFDNLVSKEKDAARLRKKAQDFFTYVRKRGDGNLIRSIVRDLEFRWQKEVLRVCIETAEKDEKKIEERKELMRKEMQKQGICADIQIRKEPGLLSGVRITLGESIRVHSSWKGMADKLFKDV